MLLIPPYKNNFEINKISNLNIFNFIKNIKCYNLEYKYFNNLQINKNTKFIFLYNTDKIIKNNLKIGIILLDFINKLNFNYKNNNVKLYISKKKFKINY